MEYGKDVRTHGSNFVITYGRLDAGDLRVLTVNGLDAARALALDFIQVIPDDLVSYQAHINTWNADVPLVITHQDDDSFFFSATWTPGLFWDNEAGAGLPEFSAFCSEFSAE